MCFSTQDFKFHLGRSEYFREMELWKTIDWNALIKVSDISHIYGIHENCDITEEFGYLGKSKLGCKQIDKEAEVTYVFYIENFINLNVKTEIMPVVNGDNFTAFKTASHFTEELVDN